MPWASSTHPGSTRASRRLRAQVLADEPYCYLRYPGCTIVPTEDEHVIPLAEGGTDDRANHRGACHNCHKIKTQQEAARGHARRRGDRPSEPHPGLIRRS